MPWSLPNNCLYVCLFYSVCVLYLAHFPDFDLIIRTTYLRGTVSRFPGSKQPERETDHSSVSIAGVQNEYNCKLTTRIFFYCINRNNFNESYTNITKYESPPYMIF
jgi:hypothetical protein